MLHLYLCVGSDISTAVIWTTYLAKSCPRTISQAYHGCVLCPKLVLWVVLPFSTAKGRTMRFLLTQRPSLAIINHLCTSALARSLLDFFKEGHGRQTIDDQKIGCNKSNSGRGTNNDACSGIKKTHDNQLTRDLEEPQVTQPNLDKFVSLSICLSVCPYVCLSIRRCNRFGLSFIKIFKSS